MLRSKRKVAPLKFVDFDCIPQDTPEEEATASNEEELIAAKNEESAEDYAGDFEEIFEISTAELKIKPDRYFTILTDSVIAEGISPKFVYSNERTVKPSNTTEKFAGKTPMQAARLAFRFISKNFDTEHSYIFYIEECNDITRPICKTYSYRGTSDINSEVIAIKSYKTATGCGSLKKTKLLKSIADGEHVFISDGFVVNKKIIPPIFVAKRSK